MTEIERAAHSAAARLNHVIASPAPDPVKEAARSLLAVIGRGVGGDDPDLVAADDAMADAVAALPGSLAMHVDFLRVLHGDQAAWPRHGVRQIGTALRDKARQLARAPTAADFAADHPVPLFAWAYWGGVDAWAAGRAGRIQRPVGYWSDRANQIAAIRAAAAQHPDVPLTHALLRRAGLHRLALMMNAAQLAALAAEAGVDRGLIYRSRGWWTADRVIDAYAAECRKAGVTLSTDALREIGGAASSLRVYAQRLFGGYAAFQRAVTARHPEIRPPDRPTATDGTVLDSWSEVVVHNALRAVLPDARIEHHVVLPGETSRSTDFVVNGRVFVEVLGIPIAGMATPTSARQRKYAAQWTAKSARYAALGIAPVMIEPMDVHDPVRLAGRIGDIARRLGCDEPPIPPPSGRQTRSKGEWTFEALCAAVEAVAGDTGAMPTFAALAAAGYGHAANLLKRPGQRARVAAALGRSDPNRRDLWTRDRVVSDLIAWAREHGTHPSDGQLAKAGLQALGSARSRLWAGAQEELRAAVEGGIGTKLPMNRAANGSYAGADQIAAALRPLARRLGRLPTGKEAAAAGLGTAWSRASRRGGVAAIAARIGVRCDAAKRWSRDEMLAEFASLAASLGGARLTTTTIRAALGSGGIARVRKLGGMAAVRAAIQRSAGGVKPAE